MKIRITGAQLPVTNDIQANLAATLRAVDVARAEGADILLTPEGSLSGYTPRFDTDAARQALEAVADAARSAGVGLALGTCLVEPDDGLCYDELRFYAPDGAYLGFHSKILLCGTMCDEPPQGELNDYAARPLRTFALNGLTVGGLICNDMWANPECTPQPDPHLTQQLVRMGARVIFHAVNGGRSGGEWSQVAWHYHETNLRMRARAGRVHIATVDSSAPVHLRCSAPSGIVAPDGSWLVRAAERGEQYYTADLALPDA
jgi:predicted amidohydrolase